MSRKRSKAEQLASAKFGLNDSEQSTSREWPHGANNQQNQQSTLSAVVHDVLLIIFFTFLSHISFLVCLCEWIYLLIYSLILLCYFKLHLSYFVCFILAPIFILDIDLFILLSLDVSRHPCPGIPTKRQCMPQASCQPWKKHSPTVLHIKKNQTRLWGFEALTRAK